MQRPLWLAVLILGSSIVVGAQIRPAESASAVDRVSDEYFSWLKQHDLMIQRELGIPLSHLPGVSIQKAEQDRTQAEKMLSELARVRDGDLDHERWLTLEILRWNLKAMVDAPRFYWLKNAVTPNSCPLNDIGDALGQFKFRNADDAERYLELVKQYAVIIRQLESKLHEQRRQSIALPKDELKVVEPYLSSLIGDAPGQVFPSGRLN